MQSNLMPSLRLIIAMVTCAMVTVGWLPVNTPLSNIRMRILLSNKLINDGALASFYLFILC